MKMWLIVDEFGLVIGTSEHPKPCYAGGRDLDAGHRAYQIEAEKFVMVKELKPA